MKTLKKQNGAVLVLFAFCLLVFMGIAALAIDIAHLVVVGNELQNAADAGALAGTRVLLNPDNTINEGANVVAYQAATANLSGGDTVEINNYTLNTGDIQRGHWTLPVGGFVANANLTQGDFFVSDPNTNPNIINAVSVTVHRSDTPSYFARFFGYENFQRTKNAIAYLGPPAKFAKHDFDIPFGICERAIWDGSQLTCNIGRAINSGNNPATNNTGGWTNFTQDPCETASASSVRPQVCGGNTTEISPYQGMGTTGGDVESAFMDLRRCWKNQLGSCDSPFSNCGGNSVVDADGNETFTSLDQLDGSGNPGSDGIPDQPWNLTLPLLECPGSNVGNCEKVVGAVNVSIVWITESGTGQAEMPPVMYHPGKDKVWKKSDYPDDATAWNAFISPDFFDLKNQDGTAPPLDKKSVYFLPTCEMVKFQGTTGGSHYTNVLAEVPVLVK